MKKNTKNKILKIYFNDLKLKKQKEVLKFFCLDSAEQGNYDIIPLFILEKV